MRKRRLELLRQYTQGKNLRLCDGFVSGCTVSEDAWDGGNLGQPAAVFFAFTLELKLHICLQCRLVYRRDDGGAPADSSTHSKVQVSLAGKHRAVTQ